MLKKNKKVIAVIIAVIIAVLFVGMKACTTSQDTEPNSTSALTETQEQINEASEQTVSRDSAEKIIERFNSTVKNESNLSSDEKQELYVHFDRQQDISNPSGTSYEYVNQSNTMDIVIFENNTGEVFLGSIEMPGYVLNSNDDLKAFMRLIYYFVSAYNDGMTEDEFMTVWRGIRDNNKVFFYNGQTYYLQDDGQYLSFMISDE